MNNGVSNDSHNELSSKIPKDVWGFIFSKLPLSNLGVRAQVSRSWSAMIQELSSQLIKRYFPYLVTDLDTPTTPLQLFTKEFQSYQKQCPTYPMDVILSALEGKIADIPTISGIEPSEVKTTLYALSVVNSHALKEDVVSKEEKKDIYRRVFSYAARNGRLGVMKWLLEKVPEISADDKGWALRFAAASGHLVVVKWLLKNVPGTPRISNDNKIVALEDAATCGHLAVVKWLLKNVPEISNDDKNVALQFAARNGHLEVVKWLLENVPTISDSDKGVALRDAAENGHLEVLKCLLEKVTVTSNDEKGAAASVHLEVVKWVLEKVRGISNDDKGQALQLAAASGHLAVVKWLLENVPEIGDKDKGWALQSAAGKGRLELVKWLLKNVPEIRNGDIDWALQKARGSKHPEVIATIENHLNQIPGPFTFAYETLSAHLRNQDGKTNVKNNEESSKNCRIM